MNTLRYHGWLMIIGLASGAMSPVMGASKPKAVAAPTKQAKALARETASAPAGGSLSAQIERLASSSRIGGMQVGIYIELLGDAPRLIYEQKSEQPFKPASNQKIVTSAAGLSLLPADFTYRTILGKRGQDLVIIGSGDPATGDQKMAKLAGQPAMLVFQKWAQALKDKGITKVSGDLLFDDYVFEPDPMHPTWPQQFKLEDYYCAPAGGLNFNDNCVDVIVKPTKVGEKAEAALNPPNSYMRLENTTKTASKGEPSFHRAPKDPTLITVGGPVSKGNSPDGYSIAVADPGMLFASACKAALVAEGIEIAGEIKRTRVRAEDLSIPADIETIAVHEQKLSELMWRIDKSSLNVFAEALLKTLGAYNSDGKLVRVGGYETGRETIQKFLQKIGVKSDHYNIDDGSGLSHANRVTPHELVTILRYMNGSPRRQEWWSNLAEPGEDGTLRKRMKAYKGKVFAKTGSIGGVSSLSGYVKAADDRIYAFSVLCNDTLKSKGMAPHDLQDKICILLANH
jgi:D-alanyl-D-alanine carboxypeptidase/D-alanyl-D-alanine-endopeptidase (penicillin-binding protein 4)